MNTPPDSGSKESATRQALRTALVASAALHVLIALWPAEVVSGPQDPPLQATIASLPPKQIDAPLASAAEAQHFASTQTASDAAMASEAQAAAIASEAQATPAPPDTVSSRPVAGIAVADGEPAIAGPPSPSPDVVSAPAGAPPPTLSAANVADASSPVEPAVPAPESSGDVADAASIAVAQILSSQPASAPPVPATTPPEPSSTPPAPITTSRPEGFIVYLRPALPLPEVAESQHELPLRVDLGYKVFLGTQGFLIGDGTYTFEHSGDAYRIVTVGQARGLAAAVVPGQGKIESRGVVTSNGLQPQEFSIERGGPDKREVARFDWGTGTVTLHDRKTELFDAWTSDPMALLWQFYFSPPTTNELRFSVATTRHLYRYTVSRERGERIAWNHGTIDTEVWHRRSDDGKSDVYAWLAPSMHYVAVKVQVVVAHVGTLEAKLDTMRVEEAPQK